MFDNTLSSTEGKTIFMSHFHQLVEASAMFLITLPMDDNITCNPNHTITVLKYLVNHVLEDVLCTGQAPGQVDKIVLSLWCVESCQQGLLIVIGMMRYYPS